MKKPSESKDDWDVYKLLANVPGEEAFRPLDKPAARWLSRTEIATASVKRPLVYPHQKTRPVNTGAFFLRLVPSDFALVDFALKHDGIKFDNLNF